MKRRPPPTFATWLLQRAGNRYQRDALIGDLLEEYGAGRSVVWYWRQVGLALLANGCERLRRTPPPIHAIAKWSCILLMLSGGAFSVCEARTILPDPELLSGSGIQAHCWRPHPWQSEHS